MELGDLKLRDVIALADAMRGGPGATEDLGLQIVVLDKGFVYVGEVELTGNHCIVENAMNVRKWGTKEGLLQLAATGPLPETRLDGRGQIRCDRSQVIHFIKCREDAWKELY